MMHYSSCLLVMMLLATLFITITIMEYKHLTWGGMLYNCNLIPCVCVYYITLSKPMLLLTI